jgi:hypothetical protein
LNNSRADNNNNVVSVGFKQNFQPMAAVHTGWRPNQRQGSAAAFRSAVTSLCINAFSNSTTLIRDSYQTRGPDMGVRYNEYQLFPRF